MDTTAFNICFFKVLKRSRYIFHKEFLAEISRENNWLINQQKLPEQNWFYRRYPNCSTLQPGEKKRAVTEHARKSRFESSPIHT